MSLPIKPTPTLKGKEAKKFRKQEISNRTKFAEKKEVEDLIENFVAVTHHNFEFIKAEELENE